MRAGLLSKMPGYGCGCPWSFPTTCKAIVIVLLLTGIAIAFYVLPVTQLLEDFIMFLKEDVGPWGPVIMVLVYIPATILALPGLILSLGGGYVFGLLLGFITDAVGATAGASAAFVVGRTVGKPYIERHLADYPEFNAIQYAIKKSSFKIVLLLRLVPLIPFNVLNYVLALTPVPLTTYICATMLGLMPMTFAFVYIGTTLKSISDVKKGSAQAPSALRWSICAFGLVATVVATVVITRIAREALQHAIHEGEAVIEAEAESRRASSTEAQNLSARTSIASSRPSLEDLQQPLLSKPARMVVVETDGGKIGSLASEGGGAPNTEVCCT